MKDEFSVKGYSLREVRNQNEKSVCRLLEKIIDRDEYSGMCFCGICIEDIFGLTLNRLPPKYKHSRTLMLKREPSDKDIESAILKCLEIVRESPKHK